jgi:cyclophilin family peptidyl-prolyl cis-trans isomerase
MYFKKFVLVLAFLTLSFQVSAATVVEFQTSAGNFTVELYPEKAPKTVANFLQYVKDGFYTNTIFHRVISRFMIQGGGFERDLTEKQTRPPVVNESNNGIGYCVFGKVIQGIEVVRKIGLVPTGNMRGFSDVPIRPIVIKQASIKASE